MKLDDLQKAMIAAMRQRTSRGRILFPRLFQQ